MGKPIAGALTLAVLTWATTATAATDAEKCEAAKNKVAGKYAFCRQKAEAKAIKSGDPADYSKCDAKFAQKWADAQANPMCPTTGDQGTMQTCITAHANRVASALNNTGTCEPINDLPATGQTTAYGTRSDGNVLAGNTLSYTDNGDGTITDNNTGLMWEKKDDAGGIHDWDNIYTWCVPGTPVGCDNGTNPMDGTIVTTFLETLNDVGGGGASCFAGFCDWRIPNFRELESIVNIENYNPAISPAFNSACVPACTVLTCSCTQPSNYWSSSTYQVLPLQAWYTYFYNGEMFANGKSLSRHARAVRGGS